MNLISIIGIFLSILGFFGAFRFSSIFFGIFIVGLFLLIYSLIIKTEVPPVKPVSLTLTESTIQYPEHLSLFCPKCGAELDRQKDFCPFCGDKVRK